MSLSIESRLGTLPPASVLSKYTARIEPYSIYGCEAALDVRPLSLKPLQAVQLTYLRRAVGFGPRSQIVPLFIETGVWPQR